MSKRERQIATHGRRMAVIDAAVAWREIGGTPRLHALGIVVDEYRAHARTPKPTDRGEEDGS